MTPEVSAIVRELRERARTLHSYLIDSFADEIEAGTFVTAAVSSEDAVTPAVGMQLCYLNESDIPNLPIGTVVSRYCGDDPAIARKIAANRWRVTYAGYQSFAYDSDLADDNVITYLPDNQ